ncbi:hypothetical protein [Nocardia pseudobrasiliensis]|uniref:Ig-like domain-containing protein n=1 Tax=Nocardia pseudobrasiliensis TaxID=45979 RepID=A0A370I6C4_9NOCA|nr:hypothetical protein [Nocardia pseudobrasiliensis]RDI66269.1 hypothetical protein DFR76_10415 [Nocardia pseudobrasiliensis]
MPYQDDIRDNYSTWLVIPYFQGDLGVSGVDRPLSQVVPLPGSAQPIMWLCPSIRVNGGPLRTYRPGEPTTVTVTVADYGGGTSLAPVTVTLWWSDPNAAFSQLHAFGQATTYVASKGGSATVTIVGTIPIAGHACLLAAVSAPNDRIPQGTGVAPGVERHWAQLNLDSVATDPQGRARSRVRVGNLGRDIRSYHISARRPDRETAAQLSRDLNIDIGSHIPANWSLIDPEGGRGDGDAPLRVVLEPGASKELLLEVELSEPPGRGSATVFEVVQHSAADPDFDVHGALGVVVTGPEG